MHHTLNGEGQEDEPKEEEIVQDEEIITIEGDIGWYSPNMNGFNINNTFVEYYNSSDYTDIKEINVKEYIESGKQSKIEENGKIYILDDYENKICANVKTTGNELEAWWVWIPRYAYMIENITMNIIFVDLNNKPIGTKYGDVLPEGYIVHPAFTPSGEDGSKNLQGIWMSKYEASEVDDVITGTIAEGNTDLPYASDTEGLQHTHIGNGAGTKLRYVTSSTKWCNAYDGTPCSNYGYYIYCSECGVRLRHFWCAKHYGPSTKVIINDENVE